MRARRSKRTSRRRSWCKPSEAALDHPTVATKPGAVLGAAAGDDGFDSALLDKGRNLSWCQRPTCAYPRRRKRPWPAECATTSSPYCGNGGSTACSSPRPARGGGPPSWIATEVALTFDRPARVSVG